MSASTSRFTRLSSSRVRGLVATLLLSSFAPACASTSDEATQPATAAAAPSATAVATFTDPPVPPKPAPGNPLKGMKFYVDPENNALKKAFAWR